MKKVFRQKDFIKIPAGISWYHSLTVDGFEVCVEMNFFSRLIALYNAENKNLIGEKIEVEMENGYGVAAAIDKKLKEINKDYLFSLI